MVNAVARQKPDVTPRTLFMHQTGIHRICGVFRLNSLTGAVLRGADLYPKVGDGVIRRRFEVA